MSWETWTWRSPTGKPQRGVDGWGSGAFGAPRGGRPHYGVDYVCEPGQTVVAPCTGAAVRVRRPYADDLSWSGLLIRVEHLAEVTLYYIEPEVVLGTQLAAGTPIGVAQDISARYKDPARGAMTPHVHAEVRLLPGVYWRPGWRLGVHFLFRPNVGTYINPEAPL